MPMKNIPAARQKFLSRMGEDLKELRISAGVSQETVADLLDWNRDAISKIENGRNNISLYDYLVIMRFLREIEPEHPALAMADRFMPRAATR